MSGVKNKRSVIDQELYDTIAIANGATQAAFFSTVAGKTKLQTNLTQPNQLPGRNEFHCDRIRVIYGPTVTLADAQALGVGHLEFKLDDVTILDAIAEDFPAGCGVHTDGSGAAAATQMSNGFPVAGAVRYLRRKIVIDPQESFVINLNYGAGITLAATTNVRVALGGIYKRQPKG